MSMPCERRDRRTRKVRYDMDLGKWESEGESQIIAPAGSRRARSYGSIPHWVIELGLHPNVTLLEVGKCPSYDHWSIQSHG